MKSKVAIITFSIFLITSFFLGCKKENDNTNSGAPSPPSPSSSGIIPLKAGNKWVLRETDYNTGGGIDTTFNLILQVVADTMISNERWFKIIINGDNSNPAYWTNRSDGFYELIDTVLPNKLFKYPASLNESYLSFSDTIKVTSVSSVITVPKGTFTTYEYHSGDILSSYDWYISPGIGFIKSNNFRSNVLEGKLELIDYILL